MQATGGAGGSSWTRQRFLGRLGASLVGLAVPGSLVEGVAAAPAAGREAAHSFVSRPDLTPPTVAVAVPAARTAPGYVFVAPQSGPGQRGPMIIDDHGDLVWFRPEPNDGTVAMDLQVQRFRGEPVLTWWRGKIAHGYGDGECVIADASYEILHVVRPGNGLPGDLHEFLLTDRGTAFLTTYEQVPFDLSPFGGAADGSLYDSIVQEIDVASGRVLFEWRSSDHVSPGETYSEVENDPLDFFHANSIDVDGQGNLLVSARNTSALYKLDRATGEIVWRLGGKRTDFALGPGAAFYWQHHVRWLGSKRITVFDDGSGDFKDEPASRGLVLNVDESARTVTLAVQDVQPQGLLAFAEGSMQQLPDGGAFIGWGSVPGFTEFSPDGSPRFDASFAGGGQSYRAFRSVWHATPKRRPMVVVASLNGAPHAFVSWNGATEVAHWRLHAGRTTGSLAAVKVVPRRAFETVIAVPATSRYVAVDALDGDGNLLRTSAPVPV